MEVSSGLSKPLFRVTDRGVSRFHVRWRPHRRDDERQWSRAYPELMEASDGRRTLANRSTVLRLRTEASAFVTGSRGGIAKIDLATGIMVWRRALAHDAVKITSPAVSGEMVVVAGTDGLTRALKQNSGELIWEASVQFPVVAPPLLSSTNVFVGTLGSTIVALDRTNGVLEWSNDLKGRVKSAMTTRNGDLYVMTEPRYVYRFGLADTSEVAVAE